MLCIVRYSFLLVMICLRSSSLAATNLQVTELTGALGKRITIECTIQSPQHGVYMYRQGRASKLKEIVYLYKDNTLAYKELKEDKISASKTFPNLNVTILNVTLNDAGLYWCAYNLDENITLSKLTLLWIDTVPDQVCPRPECPDATYSFVNIILILCAAVSLLCFFGFCFVILKRCVVKEIHTI